MYTMHYSYLKCCTLLHELLIPGPLKCHCLDKGCAPKTASLINSFFFCVFDSIEYVAICRREDRMLAPLQPPCQGTQKITGRGMSNRLLDYLRSHFVMRFCRRVLRFNGECVCVHLFGCLCVSGFVYLCALYC